MLDDKFKSDHGFVKEALQWNWVGDKKWLMSEKAGRSVPVPEVANSMLKYHTDCCNFSESLADKIRPDLIEAYLARAPKEELVSEFRDYWIAKCNAVGCDVPEKVSVTPSLIGLYCKEFGLSDRLKDFLVLRMTIEQ